MATPGCRPTRPSAQGFVCDPAGCIAKLPDGRLVSQVLTPEAFEEDCSRAAIVVTDRDRRPACAALTIDRKLTRARRDRAPA